MSSVSDWQRQISVELTHWDFYNMDVKTTRFYKSTKVSTPSPFHQFRRVKTKYMPKIAANELF